ncbi:MAG TPA: alpha/beta hydrolase [Ktedonobacterales bacterium]|nr:alpha/beta hydrolase [Ktedonobacterales bacterium]
MRARYPDQEGFVERDGVRVFYEVFGTGEPTVFLLPAWSTVHSRFWKAQVPYLARHYRVITFDGRGNGRSSRPLTPAAYGNEEFVADALAVLDATATERAVLVSLSMGAQWALLLAAEHADRVAGAAFIGPTLPISPRIEKRVVHSFDDVLDTDEGWAKYNRHYWVKDYRGFLEFFFSQCFPEPHSTKQIEDCVGWGLETTPEVLIAKEEAPSRRAINLAGGDEQHVRELAGRVCCPVLVIHGDQDAITPHARGVKLAEMTGGRLVTLEGSGHIPLARDPVKVNLLLRELVDQARSASGSLPLSPQPGRSLAWTRGRNRQKRALYISSPIGLGHAQRDAAIAAELRKLHPDLELDWLAQHPVTRVLEERGEHIYPASEHLANESRHIESESAEHDLHCSSPSAALSAPSRSVESVPVSGKWIVSSARGEWSAR